MNFENTVDRKSAVIFACLNVRSLGPKKNWIIDLSLAFVGMLTSSSKLFLFFFFEELSSFKLRCETYWNCTAL